MSLGRKDRAEPRWLLPMLCRNTGLSKDAIGAIRVQYQETFVEILTDAVSAMKQELGPELSLEQGAKLTELPGVPDFDASPKGPPSDRYKPGAAQKREPARAKTSKSKQKPDQQETPPAVKKPKPQGKTPAKNTKPRKPIHSKANSNTGPTNKNRKHPQKDAADASKPLRARKTRHKSRDTVSKASKKPLQKGSGGEARPFRKPKKKS